MWRRFDEVIWFDKPDKMMVEQFLKMKFKNVAVAFDPVAHAAELEGYSYADIDRVSVQAIKAAIVEKRRGAEKDDFRLALAEEQQRQRLGNARLMPAR